MMKNRNIENLKGIATVLLASSLLITGCSSVGSSATASADTITTSETDSEDAAVHSSGSSILDTSEMFTERDLQQEPDLTDSTSITVTDGEDVHITEEGVYVLSGTAEEMTVYVEAEDTAKVQLVLDGVSITNSEMPCIYVVSGDKVFVTTIADSSLTVKDTFLSDEENADAAIFSCQDLVLNGTATLTITSSDVGVDSKDDLKVTGGTYHITAGTKAFEANDSIRIANGSFTLQAGTDGLHAENKDDDTLGYVYIAGGTFDIQVGDDGIHGNSIVQIDGGTMQIDAVEAIEGTYVQINGGTISITASDDGINAGQKSNSYDVTIEITGGDITIDMAAGDTDALDANGDLIISGGTITISATSAFDYDRTGTLSGGTVVVNGEEVTELTQVMMGGGMPGEGMPGGGMAPPNGEMGNPPQGNENMPQRNDK